MSHPPLANLLVFSLLLLRPPSRSLPVANHYIGLGTCAQGALATWGGPVRAAFSVPPDYKLVCGVSIGYPSTHVVNSYNPGRGDVNDLLIPQK